MRRLLLPILLLATPAFAQVQGPPLTVDAAVDLARASSPTAAAAAAAIDAASAARRAARLRPNPTASVDVENVGGSRAYDIVEAPNQTVSLAYPIELGGKRAARIGVAEAQGARAAIDRASVDAELRLAVTRAYGDALAADRRLANAREQARIAADGLHAAQVRVEAGRASPLEESRAGVVRNNAGVAVEQAARLASAARATLVLLIGQPALGPLDAAWFDRIAGDVPVQRSGALAVAASRADVATAAAQERLARSQRVPDVTVSAGVRRVPMVGSSAAVIGLSVPLPLFNNGSAALAQVRAERTRAEALARTAELEADRAVIAAEAERDNAASAARATNGPTLATAQEAARIANIGYREGKFGQLDLIDAERALAETRAAAIDALAAYHDAQARLDRLTTPYEETRK
ncbi:TolC family protein [Sphingomonas profundi]|uniref:TolC family protein n=1 Tax=Alterirhizorhabdus profundi TaxID=2681549 RepID=UPI0012E96CBA|nr:TolC family protein [Sphingomonas profundi]